MNQNRRTNKTNRKKSPKGGFSGNHQRGWLWGHHAVTETLSTGVWPVIEIFTNSKAADRFSDLLSAKQKAGIPIQVVDNDRLEQLTRSTEHQGLAIRLGPFPYQSIESLTGRVDSALSESKSDPTNLKSSVPLVVICDRLQDAFNFGAILRCCDGANVMGVIVGDHSQAPVTPHVVRSSSGAVNHLSIIKVSDLVETALQLKQQGMQVVAADANTQSNVWNSTLTGPTVLIIGSEATGVQPDLLSICDQRLWIPMQGKVTSLNAAVASGILLYEIRRQQFSSC
ncbi:MAG: 23S rRNA (guanosine(2251)-2'-O)-methyltransferase RlmB [Rubripirellula sp.]